MEIPFFLKSGGNGEMDAVLIYDLVSMNDMMLLLLFNDMSGYTLAIPVIKIDPISWQIPADDIGPYKLEELINLMQKHFFLKKYRFDKVYRRAQPST